MPSPTPPSNTELQALSVLWFEGPSTVNMVHARLSDGRERAYTTVLSLLQNLERKGLVTRVRKGRSNLYRAMGSPNQIVRERAEQYVRNTFCNRLDEAVLSVLASGNLTPDEKLRVQEALDKHKTVEERKVVRNSVKKKVMKKTGKKAVKTAAKKPVKKAAKKVTKKAAKKPTKKAAKKAAKKAVKKSAVKKSAKKAAQKSVKKVAKKAMKKVGKKAAKKVTKRPAKVATKNSKKSGVKKAGKKAAKKVAKKSVKRKAK